MAEKWIALGLGTSFPPSPQIFKRVSGILIDSGNTALHFLSCQEDRGLCKSINFMYEFSKFSSTFSYCRADIKAELGECSIELGYLKIGGRLCPK